ncbi:MAG: ATP-dependent Clp protease adaptor ClpS [Myxococcales bacterium]|nr:ATP-dependent Clp protease adaptor ClpS [Myxococcales bacterium]
MPAPIPFSPEVTGVLVEAARSARGKELHDAHFVAALLRIGAVESALAETGVDVASLARLVAGVVERLPKRPWYRLALSVAEPVSRAAARAAATGQRELSSLFLFASIAQDGSADVLAALANAGFSLLAFRWRVAHGAASRDEPRPATGAVRLVLHDDPFTTVAFVDDVLREELGRDHETAQAISARVGREGRAELTAMDAEKAAAALARIRARADALRFPLRVSAVAA